MACVAHWGSSSRRSRLRSIVVDVDDGVVDANAVVVDDDDDHHHHHHHD